MWEDHGVLHTEADPDDYGCTIGEPTEPIWQQVGGGRLQIGGTLTVADAPTQWQNPTRTVDWKWNATGARTNDGFKTDQYITYQLGSAPVSWRYVIHSQSEDNQTTSPKLVWIQKGDSVSGPWTTVKTMTINNQNTWHVFDCGAQSSKYMRFMVKTNWGGNYVSMDEIAVGNLV